MSPSKWEREPPGDPAAAGEATKVQERGGVNPSHAPCPPRRGHRPLQSSLHWLDRKEGGPQFDSNAATFTIT